MTDRLEQAIARALLLMPSRDFRARLKSELLARASMRTVTPYIAVQNEPKLVEFLKHTFGAEHSPAGIRIGDSLLRIAPAEPGRERIGAFHVYVPDCDAAYRRALEAGGFSMGEPADRPYGERSGFVRDFAGNHWYIATRFPSNVPPEDLGTVLPFLLLSNARAFIDFVKRAFAAEEMAVFEQSGRVMHAAVRIGDAVLEMGEPPEAQSLPGSFLLSVDDCDATYQRAIAAGATALREPDVILDPFGYQWILSPR
jgi:uncharacterized glyoxalase superfamily protein PhnB